MTMLDTRIPDFPTNPSDGFQIKEDLPDGGYVIWTYSEQFNQWTYEVFTAAIDGFIYTRQVRTTPTEIVNASGAIEIIETQEQVNNLISDVADRAVKATARTADQVDFLQNSIGKGSWMHTFAGVGFPQTSEFWTKDNVTNFADITRILVNDKGLAAQGTNDPGTLSDTRVGDYLIIQERGSNDFGMYVVDDVAFEVIEGQTIREFGLKLYEGRGNGQTIVNSSRCQITTSRPMYVVVQDTEPKVSTRGVLWYREGDDILSISNYATGQVGVNGPQWTAINGGGPDANPDDYLKLSGGTMKGELAMGGHKVTGIGDPAADAQAANKRYVDTRLKRTGGTEQKMQGILYLGGHKIAGVGDPELSTDAANRKYVDNQIAAIPEPEVGGGSFIDDYDGNRFCRAGNLQTNLNSGDVLFMDADYNSTEKPDEIAYISLPKDEFDWHAFTNSGNIKVKAGSSTAGYYYAFAYMHQSSDQVLVSVFPLKTYPDKKLEADSGAPCYFNGLFFSEGAKTSGAAFSLPDGRRRARNSDGTFRGDDPSTPDVNEAWVDGEA